MSAKARKAVSLALQGGGALGAYTWGVLDRLLEDDRIEIAAVSGTSAGAMCAVVMAEGLVSGGAESARRKLRAFWEGVARAGLNNPYRRTPMMAFLSSFTPAWLQAPSMAQWADAVSAFSSPYDFNPLNTNPLKELLEELVDFAAVRKCKTPQLFLGATNVDTGRIEIFETQELTAEHVMASACLPQLFQAVVIDGVPYWDGGFTGNPALFPLFTVHATRDIVIVQVQPIERRGAPRSAADIAARVNEVTFNASLLSELRAIEFVDRLIDENRLPADGRHRQILVHNVSEDEPLRPLVLGVDLNTDLAHFESLFGQGRAACEHWLGEHFDDLGERSTVDLKAMFLDEPRKPGKKPLK
ncbi:patatin-like phospholipase family protein [Terricaulis sp.]|uniref:patatin-like phospholipase family protein n=1 Tax=Terricaulis sp. TaxID=2768686 RepID=UPI0037848E0A